MSIVFDPQMTCYCHILSHSDGRVQKRYPFPPSFLVNHAGRQLIFLTKFSLVLAWLKACATSQSARGLKKMDVNQKVAKTNCLPRHQFERLQPLLYTRLQSTLYLTFHRFSLCQPRLQDGVVFLHKQNFFVLFLISTSEHFWNSMSHCDLSISLVGNVQDGKYPSTGSATWLHSHPIPGLNCEVPHPTWSFDSSGKYHDSTDRGPTLW